MKVETRRLCAQGQQDLGSKAFKTITTAQVDRRDKQEGCGNRWGSVGATHLLRKGHGLT